MASQTNKLPVYKDLRQKYKRKLLLLLFYILFVSIPDYTDMDDAISN